MGLILATFTGWGDAKAEESMTPFERAVSTPKGQLKSPYADFASVAEEGHKIYLNSRLQWLPWRRWWRRNGGAPHQSGLDLWR